VLEHAPRGHAVADDDELLGHVADPVRHCAAKS
jgi:hypothetical protein